MEPVVKFIEFIIFYFLKDEIKLQNVIWFLLFTECLLINEA